MKAALALALAACCALGAAALTSGPAQTVNDAIVALPADAFVYNPTVSNNLIRSAGGASTPRQLAQFPALANMGISQTAFTMNGCALRPVHTHMRATGLLYVIQAANMSVGFITESGKAVVNQISTGASTIFPQGLLHYQQNNDCSPAYYTISYNHEDPGTQVTIPGMNGLPASVVTASLGAPYASFAGLVSQTPKQAFIASSDPDCVARCQARGIDVLAPAPAVNPSALPLAG